MIPGQNLFPCAAPQASCCPFPYPRCRFSQGHQRKMACLDISDPEDKNNGFGLSCVFKNIYTNETSKTTVYLTLHDNKTGQPRWISWPT